METKIREDYVSAMKAKDAVKKSTLSLLISAIDSEKKTSKRDLTEDEIVKIITKEAKKRNQSIEAYTIGNRVELAAKEEQELLVLESYLPKALTYSELLEVVKQFKSDNPGMHEGKLLGMVNKETKGVNKIEDIKKAIAEA